VTDRSPSNPSSLPVGFNAVSYHYEAGRPVYPAAAVDRLLEGFRRPISVVDVGAGTGQLTKRLVDAGVDVTAVEPMPTTRSHLAAAAGARARVVDGTAERLPLDDASADLVTAADSYHWFDPPIALPEIRRVLRLGSRFAVGRLIPAWTPEQSADWAAELGAIVAPIWNESGHPLDHESMADAALASTYGFVNVRTEEVPFTHHTDRIGVHSLFMSMSIIGALSSERRAAVATEFEDVLERHHIAKVQLSYVARLWISTRS
jgi:SAM-dependent methyltransferase